MADPANYGNPDRETEQALLALKKGSQLIKYSRKGKPKFCPFRVSSICKDQAEAEVWFTGLNALIPSGPQRRSVVDGQSDRISCSDDGDFGRLYGASLDITSSTNSRESFSYSRRSDVGSDHANMQLRIVSGDVGRVSVSSAPSCSSQGSGQDDIESLGDVYVWGEVWCDGGPSDGCLCSKTDALIPRPLESNVVLDVQQIACGSRHAALVTRQGEVFTWGEESGGRLGNGNDADVSRPHLVDTVTVCNVETVACGEYHTCAISSAGDLFTWGDGTYKIGLLGHGTAVSHWKPKRVSGPLEGVQVLSLACGTWHSALTTFNGKVYTFGDGTFGVLGHGDRESVAYPREVEALNGLRTVRVACGVWHSAAIVEVSGQSGINVISRKLFTWGAGDKYRLGHGDKEERLIPTCVPSLIEYNFHQLACGHDMTVALATSGHVLTWGSTAYGQLGNPQSDGKLPCVVQDRLSGELIEEIDCGAYHVTVLTSRSEVYTWGSGANGRLGHGDTEDRKTPTLVEALKDRHVKSISCGSNFTACICIHKWISSADQSVCSGCRQAFGFTRKRHNCYNCGLVHCHACISKKVLKAALAPTPGKPHRVCDSCYSKIKVGESGISSTLGKKNAVSHRSTDIKEKFHRGGTRSSRVLLSTNTGAIAAPTPPPLPANAYSKPSSPFSRRLNAQPISSGSFLDSLKMNNEQLDKEVIRLQAQVRNLKRKYELQELALKKSEKKAEEATSLIAEVSTNCSTVAKYIKSVELQLKNLAGKVPKEVGDNLKAILKQAESLLKDKGSHASKLPSSLMKSSENGVDIHYERTQNHKDKSAVANTREATGQQNIENGSSGVEVTEQFEHGVYVTLVQNPDGTRDFKRVRFR
ncbi:uncharacterized protein LOC109836225 [Asparagus officinalis]|uniref:uncharacterized protein LOC109836225 n=1 Tax=Asparagus officinalis TaxID=4686 RepID=UPI00098E6B6A|nr:uncharacterized protein LOC109836225 [Asparagus officinalis]